MPSSVSGQMDTAPVRGVRRAHCPSASCQDVTRTQPKLPWCTKLVSVVCSNAPLLPGARQPWLPSPTQLLSHDPLEALDTRLPLLGSGLLISSTDHRLVLGTARPSTPTLPTPEASACVLPCSQLLSLSRLLEGFYGQL